MHQRVRALGGSSIESISIGLPRAGIPSDDLRRTTGSVSLPSIWPDEPGNCVALAHQRRNQRCSQESRRAGNQNAHGRRSPYPDDTLRRHLGNVNLI
jgi:hypothetical protein